MGLRCEVDHIVEIVLTEETGDKFFVADVSLDEHMAWITFTAFEVFKIASIGELVQVDEQDIVILLQHIVDEIGADESGTAGDKILFHINTLPFLQLLL